MEDIADLERRLDERLAAAEEQRHLHQTHVEQRMADLDHRYHQFNEVADDVVGTVIRPRVEKLAGHFDNAEVLPPERGTRHHCVCRFSHTARFPATTTLSLGVCPDERIENLLALYNLEILPVFFQFEGEHRVGFPIEQVDHAKLAEWVDQKILDFVDTYLRLEKIDQYQRENLVTDPVCGMRIAKTQAAAQMDYEGKPYFFCVEECRRKFAEDPAHYVSAARH